MKEKEGEAQPPPHSPVLLRMQNLSVQFCWALMPYFHPSHSSTKNTLRFQARSLLWTVWASRRCCSPSPSHACTLPCSQHNLHQPWAPHRMRKSRQSGENQYSSFPSAPEKCPDVVLQGKNWRKRWDNLGATLSTISGVYNTVVPTKPCWYRGWFRAVTSGALKHENKAMARSIHTCFMCLNWEETTMLFFVWFVQSWGSKINKSLWKPILKTRESNGDSLCWNRVNKFFCPEKSDWILAAGFSSYPEQWFFLTRTWLS